VKIYDVREEEEEENDSKKPRRGRKTKPTVKIKEALVESSTDDEDEDEEQYEGPSAIGQHLASHPECLEGYRDSQFTVLCRARSFRHLKVLEAVFIHVHDPDLCKQKNNVTALNLYDNSAHAQRRSVS